MRPLEVGGWGIRHAVAVDHVDKEYLYSSFIPLGELQSPPISTQDLVARKKSDEAYLIYGLSVKKIHSYPESYYDMRSPPPVRHFFLGSRSSMACSYS